MVFLYVLLAIFCSLCALAVVLGLLYLLVCIRPRARKADNPRLLCHYAHRGLHENSVPENSLAAFEKACQSGHGIELDVQLSADGEVMVFHDYTLNRMTGKDAKVKDLTCAELQALSLSGTEHTIPTFSEVLALVNGRTPLLVELKGEDLNAELCPKVAALLRDYKGDFCIESFNPLLIRAMRREMPKVWYGQLYTNVCKDKKKIHLLNILLTLMAFNFLARPDFIAYNYLYRDTVPVKLATKLYTAERFVWTVRNREELNTCEKNGEHAIFENL